LKPMSVVIQQAIQCVLSLFFLVMVGFVLARRGWFSPETKAMLPRLVTVVTLPPYLFLNIVKTFDSDQLHLLFSGSLIPALSMLLTFGLSNLAARLMKVRRERVGLMTVGATTSNTIFIGIPVNISLFGEEALPFVLLYFFANTTFFWTVGNYCLSLGGERAPEKILSPATFKRLFSPPLLGFAAGVLMVMAGFTPPPFLADALGYLGSLTTPLAILFIGITLAGVSLKNLRPDRDVAAVLLGRFVLSPLTIIILVSLFPLPPLMAKVFIIQASLPVVSSAVLLAGYYRSDPEYASVVVSLSTVMSLLTIPLFMAVISALNF